MTPPRLVTSATATAPRLKRLTLELSPKPFRDSSATGTDAVIREILSQWGALIENADSIAFLFWTADGSEILDYRGHLDDPIRWARFIGIANDPPPHTVPGTLHGTARVPYCDDPPPATLTYARLREILAAIRRIVAGTIGKPVSLGTTFDPGPEFAESDFKYRRHPEINKGGVMGDRRWLHCASALHADDVAYATFPEGIPEGTPFGTFLGRQARRFMEDVGFDYIWFSNGFGYSLDSWNCTGEVFDGQRFDPSGSHEVNRSILKFWHDFRRECPDHPIETRGSNLSTAMDLSAHASPVRDIYDGGFDLVAPPNSPWAALDGDYGLELVGWMSHIAHLPGGDAAGFPFRYYIHDPWWLNSPWLDRYGREPHDIYLPLACGRVGPDGAIRPPASLALLTVDDSLGRLPREVPNETTPHILRALADHPDAPGPLTWVYPFDEYHDRTFATPSRASEVFFGDWFMRTGVNHGLPLNTVVSTANFLRSRAARPGLYAATTLVCPAPDAGTPWSAALLDHVRRGGAALLYGPLTHVDPEVLALLGLTEAEAGLEGELAFRTTLTPDTLRGGVFPEKIKHRSLLNGGPIDHAASPDSSAQILATVANASGDTRPFAVHRTLEGGGHLLWLRGALSFTATKASQLPVADDPAEWFQPALLLRWMLEKTGVFLRFDKTSLTTADPLVLCAVARGGWVFSGFTPNTTTTLRWRFPQGVPVPTGCDVRLIGDGTGALSLPAAWHRECRLLVTQAGTGDLSCREKFSGEIGINRRLRLEGLDQATVTFFPDTTFPAENVRIQLDQGYLGRGPAIPFRRTPEGHCVTTAPVSGTVLFSW